MSTITSHGLNQEFRLVRELCTRHADKLQPRGVTDAKLTEYSNADAAMTAQGGALKIMRSTFNRLTTEEVQLRGEVERHFKRMKQQAKNAFGNNAPELKEFHVGDEINGSTPRALRYGAEILAAWDKHKDVMTTKGSSLQQDRDDLAAALDALQAKDTEQEKVKIVDSPEATAAFEKAKDATRAIADWIHKAAEGEFAGNVSVLNEFAQAKKKRFEAAPHNTDDGQNTPPDSGGTPPPPTN